jgi:Domain of unknown function (DUF4124)
MVRRFPSALLLVLAMSATPVLAETYKWVDAKGVVTYSDTPPPSMAAKTKVIEERISVIPPDPSLGPAVAAMQARAERRAQAEEADYARRQQYMLQAQANEAATGCYGGDCSIGYDAPYYYPYAVAGRGYRGGRRHAPYASHYEDLPTYSDLPRYPGTRVADRPGGRVMHARGASFAGRGPGR